MTDSSHVGEARRFAAELCENLDFDQTRAGRVGIVINELGNNLVRYAQSGRILLRAMTGTPAGIEILSIDSGPGIENVADVLADGFTTGSTPGTGLGSVKRLSEAFDIYSRVGSGTVLVAVVNADDQPSASRYEIGCICVPVKGEVECGDGWSVSEDPTRFSILMADGLGHGPQAHKASQEAVLVFQQYAPEMRTERLLHAIHARLKSTRGGAVFLAEITDARHVCFAGVGNIRAFLQTGEGTKTLISHNGTAGLQMRTTRPLEAVWHEGFLILHSDGISSRWDFGSYPGILQRHPALAAALAFRDHVRGNDDVSIVVVGKRL